MKKVILKCKLKSREAFVKKLSDIDFNFSPILWQHDRIYVPRGYKRGMNYPRLIMRTEMKTVDKPATYYFILRRHIEDSGVDVVEETEIKDYEKIVNIILQLGFKPIAEVSRRREILDMGGETYIYLDKIDNLAGFYAKIESKLSEKDTVSEAKDDLRKTFMTLGEREFIESTYFELGA